MKRNIFFYITLLYILFLGIQMTNAKEINNSEKTNVVIVITQNLRDNISSQDFFKNKIPLIKKFKNHSVSVNGYKVKSDKKSINKEILSGSYGYISAEDVLLPEFFKKNGYSTALFGENFIGYKSPLLPKDIGFIDYIKFNKDGEHKTRDTMKKSEYFDAYYLKNGKETRYKGYSTDVFFKQATQYMKVKLREGKPFFIYITPPIINSSLNFPKNYDHNFGNVISVLSDFGFSKNTILIFTTYKKEGQKGECAVPFYIYWKKGNIVGGKNINKSMSPVDVYSTLVDLCNLKGKQE